LTLAGEYIKFHFACIEQFRTVIRNVKHKAQVVGVDADGEYIMDRTRPMPTLKFQGTVKLHGTNAGIVYDIDDDTFTYQSRERVLSLTEDNAGFMLWATSHEGDFRYIVENLWIPDEAKKIVIFGEWCGRGIQKGVAVSELPKMFVIFAIKAIDAEGDSIWLDISEDKDYLFCCGCDGNDFSIQSIYDFPTYEIDIDFNFPAIAQNKMIEITEAVEAECPVGKHFGVSGIGEGVVWACVTEGWESSNYWFKVKGEKHSASKVKTLAPIDIEAIESMNSFVDSMVTESRLEQGLDNLVREQLKPFEMSSMGDFLRWVFNDVIKEETDTIVANGIDQKKLGGPIANKAKNWFIAKLNGEL
jgi:hypothetical protein